MKRLNRRHALFTLLLNPPPGRFFISPILKRMRHAVRQAGRGRARREFHQNRYSCALGCKLATGILLRARVNADAKDEVDEPLESLCHQSDRFGHVCFSSVLGVQLCLHYGAAAINAVARTRSSNCLRRFARISLAWVNRSNEARLRPRSEPLAPLESTVSTIGSPEGPRRRMMRSESPVWGAEARTASCRPPSFWMVEGVGRST